MNDVALCEICGEDVLRYCTCVRCLECGELFSEDDAWMTLDFDEDGGGCVLCGLKEEGK